ncbi:hypothetical protein OHA88_11925 [Streptomyces sp. NBC_00353]|uniref:hypothetical protein n=1 Tax=Streptomyces sp. NBC_00353 TaxID=2975722 RepID=UPI002E270F71
MGRLGTSYDNALAESLWQSLKRESVYTKAFSTMSQAPLEISRLSRVLAADGIGANSPHHLVSYCSIPPSPVSRSPSLRGRPTSVATNCSSVVALDTASAGLLDLRRLHGGIADHESCP